MAKKIDATNILLENIINAIQDVKGKEIISLDLRKIDSAICKYFVICTGTSNTHVNSIESNTQPTDNTNTQDPSWFQKNKTPIIVFGLVALVVGGYFIINRKK